MTAKYKQKYPRNAIIMKHNPSKALKDGEMRNKDGRNKHYIWNHRRTDKEELQQRNRLRIVSRKTRAGEVGVGVGRGFKNQFYSRGIPPLDSDAAPNHTCSKPSLQRQRLFPKTLPLKWICCYGEYLMSRLICKKGLVLFLFPYRTCVSDMC